MTPDQAIKNIDYAIAQVPANRETHQVLIQSLEVFKSLIPTEPTPVDQETQK